MNQPHSQVVIHKVKVTASRGKGKRREAQESGPCSKVYKVSVFPFNKSTTCIREGIAIIECLLCACWLASNVWMKSCLPGKQQ